MHNISEKIDMAVQKIIALGGPKVRFIILYGSANEGRMKEDSDIDISVYYCDADASEFRLKVLPDFFDEVCDIKIFQQHPLPMHCRVWKGKVLYEDDKTFLHDKADKTINEFESFTCRYYDCLIIEAIEWWMIIDLCREVCYIAEGIKCTKIE